MKHELNNPRDKADASINALIAILTASLEINMLEYFGHHLLGFLEDNLTKGSQKLHPGDKTSSVSLSKARIFSSVHYTLSIPIL